MAFWLLGVSSVLILLLATILPPTAQSLAYHQFIDQKAFLGIPNFLNVTSNLAILISGIVGVRYMWQCYRSPSQQSFNHIAESWPYLVVFLSVVMIGFGSAYYHLAPDNETLLWDRLPIATGVTALLAAALVERVGFIGLKALPLLVALGASSVIYWYWTEQQGAGNLNFYVVVQFYSLLLVVLLTAFLPSSYTRGGDMYTVVGLYATAKVAETFDREIYVFTGMVSGHTIKHLLAAVAIYLIVRMLQKRRLLQDGS